MELLCWISLLLTAIDTVESGGLGQGGGRGSGILEKKKSLKNFVSGMSLLIIIVFKIILFLFFFLEIFLFHSMLLYMNIHLC